MARKESRKIKTLRGFVAWAEQFTDGKYLFRGVSRQLITSLQGDDSKWQAKSQRCPEAEPRKPVSS